MENEVPRCPYCAEPLSENLVCKSCNFAFQRCSRCGALVVAGVNKCPQCGELIVPLKSPEPSTPASGHRGDLPVWFDPLGIGSKLLLAYFTLGAIFAAIITVFMYRARIRFINEFSDLFSQLGLSSGTGYYYDMGLAIGLTSFTLFTIGAVSLIILRVKRGKRQ